MGMAWVDRLRDGTWDMLAGACWHGMDRRLRFLSSDRLGYRSVQFPLVVLFVPHVVLILGMFFSGPVMLAMWALGQALPDAPWFLAPFLTAFSIPFFLFIPVILGRRATVLDRQRREVREVRGLSLPLLPILPVLRRRHAWDGFREVLLRLEHRSSGKSSTEVYAVSLARADGDPVPVVDALRFLTGRRLAERVASFMGLTLRDETGAEHVVRRADALDQPLAEQGRPAGREPGVPRRWQVVKDDSRGWEADLPAPAFSHWRKLGLAALLAAAAMGLWQARPPDPGPAPIPVIAEAPRPDWRPPSLWPGRIQTALRFLLAGAGCVCGATALGLALAWLWHLGTWPRGYRVTVEGGALVVLRRGPLGRRRVRFDREELEELRLGERGGSHCLTAISDRKLLHFAQGLEESEARQLRRALVWQIRSRAG
jgi:hypothetical protein